MLVTRSIETWLTRRAARAKRVTHGAGYINRYFVTRVLALRSCALHIVRPRSCEAAYKRGAYALQDLRALNLLRLQHYGFRTLNKRILPWKPISQSYQYAGRVRSATYDPRVKRVIKFNFIETVSQRYVHVLITMWRPLYRKRNIINQTFNVIRAVHFVIITTQYHYEYRDS